MERRLLRRGAVVVCALLLSLFAAAPASATSNSTGPGGVVIHCTISADYPHPSTHVNGTINGVAHVNCDGIVRQISAQAFLVKSGGPAWSGAPKSPTNTTYVNVNAATSCSNGPGSFSTKIVATVYFPYSFTPAQASVTIASPFVGAACGVAFAPQGSTEEVFATLTSSEPE